VKSNQAEALQERYRKSLVC